MTDEQRAELKRLAEAAPSNPGITVQVSGDDATATRAVGEFIIAANPAAVLDLLAEHEEDQGVIRVWRGRAERAEAERDNLKPKPVRECYSCKVCGRRLLDAIPCDEHPMMPVKPSLPDANTLVSWLDHEQREGKALASALHSANERWQRAEAENERLKAEIQRLRIDLEEREAELIHGDDL